MMPHRLIQFTVLLSIAEFSRAAVTLMPVDYLIPPPPVVQALPPLAPTIGRLAKHSSNRKILPPNNSEPPESAINRAARWFGYTKHNGQKPWPDLMRVLDDSKQAASLYHEGAIRYLPNVAPENKRNCNACNKYPWMPMLQNSNQWTPQTYQQTASQDAIAGEPHHGTSKIKQRAVQYNGPQINLLKAPFNAYKSLPKSTFNYDTITPTTITPVPGNDAIQSPTHYTSSPTPSPTERFPTSFTEETFVEPFSTYSDENASFEIIKSQEVAEYVSAVEHPISIGDSQAIDVNVSAHITLPSNHKTESSNIHDRAHDSNAHFIPETENLIQDLVNSEESVEELYKPPSPSSPPPSLSYKYLPQLPFEADNLLAASLQKGNSTSVPVTTSRGGDLDRMPSTTTERVWITKSNDYHYTTIVSEINSAEDLKTKWLLESLHDYGSREFRRNRLKNFWANIRIPAAQQHQEEQLQQQLYRPRVTPKELLTAPIQFMSKGLMDTPRPFTRDPAILSFHNKHPKHHRLTSLATMTTTIKPNYSVYERGPQATLLQTIPTPTSTYGAIDASGYYASISPPPPQRERDREWQRTPRPFQSFTLNVNSRPLPSPNTNVSSPPKKYILPFNVQNPPRPFASLKQQKPYVVELVPEESMLFDVQSEEVLDQALLSDPTNEGNISSSVAHTKHLTKILAHNLRELLKREHERPSGKEANAISFDLIKLQNNIDEWIEQEYSSPKSHSNVPTIRGVSKHIPVEYVEMLAATTMRTMKILQQRQGKTFKHYYDINQNRVDALSVSVNSLEPILSTTPIAMTTRQQEMDELDGYSITEENERRESIGNYTTNTDDPNDERIFSYATVEELPNELWKKAAVTVLPETQEKLYVVTPQSISVTDTTAAKNDGKAFAKHLESPLKMIKEVFMAPGFSVRSSSIQSETPTTVSSQNYRATNFGFEGVTTYEHKRPVEIIDGNSKVVMIVTPSSRNNDDERGARTTTSVNIMDLRRTKPATTVAPKIPSTPR